MYQVILFLILPNIYTTMTPNSLSLNQIAYNVLNALRGGRSSNNDHISTDQIKFIIKYWRAIFIRRDQERNFNRFSSFEQSIGLVPLKEESIDINLYLYKTDLQIPTPVRLKDGHAITYVSIDEKQIPFVDFNRHEWSTYNKYTSKKPEAYYSGGYIYVKSHSYIEEAEIRGIFEDPEDVFDFVNASSPTAIYDANSPFPMPLDMVDQIMSGILNGTLNLAAQTLNDTTTDTLQGA